MVDLSIVIVNYNVKHRLRECLQSIYGNTKKISFEVTVVDNNSSDGSVDMVKSEFPEVKLIENCKNLGFAKATNQGLKENRGRYILLLNPDTIVLPDALDKMVEFLEVNSHAGALGCKLLYPDGSLQRSCRSFPTLITAFFENTGLEKFFPRNKLVAKYRMGYWDYDDIREVDQPMGSALMISRKVFERVGFLDEQFYMFFEEVDWCFRAKKRGWKIYFTPRAEIVHYGSQSARPTMPRMMILGYKSKHRFFRKHYGILSECMVKQMDLLGLILKTLYRTATLPINSIRGNNRGKEYSRGSREILKDYYTVIKRFWEIWI